MPSRLEQTDCLDAALEAAKRRLRLVTVGMAVLGWTAAAVTWLLVFVALDHALREGVPERARAVTSAALVVASGVWLAMAAVLPAVRRVNDLYVARLIEHAHPEFRNTLVDAIQLRGRVDLPGSVVTAVVARAAGEVAGVSARRCVPGRGLRRLAVVNAVVLGIFGVYVLLAPKPVGPSVRRAIGLAAPAPTRTRILEIGPADGTSVLRGQAVTFTARLAGQRPRETLVRFRPEDEPAWLPAQQLALVPPEGSGLSDQPWQATKAGQDLQQPIIWQIVAGDAVSEERRLDVRPVPGIADMRVRCEYPSYTGLAPTTQPGGEIDVVAGTRVTIEATANVPAFGPMLILGRPPGDKRQVLAEPDREQPGRFIAKLTVTEDSSYCLQFRDAQKTQNPHPIWHPIRARPDHAPVVRIHSPEPHVEVEPADSLRVTGRVEDDYGLTRVQMQYRLAGQPETRQLGFDDPPRNSGRMLDLNRTIPVHELAARPGDTIEWWVAAWDNREDQAGRPIHQRTDSEVRRVVVREPAAPTEPPVHLAEDQPLAPPEDQERASTAVTDTAPADALGLGEPPPELAMLDEPLPLAEINEQSESGESDARKPEPADRADPTTPREFARAHEHELATLARYLSTADQPPTAEHAVARELGEASSPSADQGEDHAQGSGSAVPEPATAQSPVPRGGEDPKDKSPGNPLTECVDAEPGRQPRLAMREREEECAVPAEGQVAREGTGSPAPATTAGSGKIGEPQPGKPEEHASDEPGLPASSGASDTPKTAHAAAGDKAAPAGASAAPPADAAGSSAEQSDSPAEQADLPAEQSDSPVEQASPPAEQTSTPGPAAEGQSAGSATDDQSQQPGETSSESAAAQPKSPDAEPEAPQEGARGATGGGGAPSRHGQDDAPELPPPAAPPPEASPPERPSPSTDDTVTAPGQVAEVMDALERRLRQDDLDPAMLDALDWDLPRARQFVEEYRRVTEGLQAQLPHTAVPAERVLLPLRSPSGTDQTTDPSEVLRAAGPAEAGTGGHADTAMPPDATSDLLQAHRQRVLPHHQDLLDAYYRSVSSQPADR